LKIITNSKDFVRMKELNGYLAKVNTHYLSGIATEHTYRADLEALLRDLTEGVEITNEPSKVTDCGNPDYVITKGKIPVGFIEAKDLGKDLNSKTFNEQFNRYREALDNLIITDYIWFKFYKSGELVHEIRIAEIIDGEVKPLFDNFDEFANLIKDFVQYISQTIKSSKRLAEMMASKARLLETILKNAVTSDESTQEDSSLKQQYQTFKEILIHDLTPSGFADIYAQTLAYGMFAARLHDPTLEDFSRQEAAELIPKSNPFLRKLFSHVGGVDIDDRIKVTVDNLADVFRATDIRDLLKDFGKSTQTQDPIIHFYETFLAEYNPKLRKSRGVWYTPEPVVDFIVRGVDDILKSEFGLKDGLADTSKTTVEVEAQGTAVTKGRNKGKPLKETQEVHKVQVLDPATGTGTFLAAVVKFIYQKKFQAMQGVWSGYVEEHLIPRLNGFELLMASYSMAHLKLDMLLKETGYESKTDQRFNIFLTNSLEEHHPDTGTLFSTWLSSEANEANRVKRDTPVMVVMGNPPYSGESANKGDWIMDLMEDYKKEPDSNEKLKERNPKWINDDYVKFLRYGQHFIEQNGEGVLAYICPHGFLDNPTFRGMRWNLLKTYDKIYTLDLHGNSKKKEVSPDGSPDVNVFDIMQGVSINFFVKTKSKSSSKLAQVFLYDLYGSRSFKYDYLKKMQISTIPYQQISLLEPMYYMVDSDFESAKQYAKGFNLKDLFPIQSVGVVTARDKFVINDDKNKLIEKITDFYQLTADQLKLKYKLKENSSWKIDQIKSQGDGFCSEYIKTISYRPFDKKYIYFDKKFIERDRYDVMKHFSEMKNIGLNWIRPMSSKYQFSIFISGSITDQCSAGNKSAGAGISYIAPLYLVKDDIAQVECSDLINLCDKEVNKFENQLKLPYSIKGEADSFSPINLIDYVYACLYSPSYIEKYKQFLNSDFPKVPYPKSQDIFWELVKFGAELRGFHLLEAGALESYITSYPNDGDNSVTRKIISKDWELYNEESQPWEFSIGGYQPAQKWLKDRKERTLSYDDILHYQKIIVALNETHRIMGEIDKIDFDG